MVWAAAVTLRGTGKLIGSRMSVRCEWGKECSLVAIEVKVVCSGELTWRLVSLSFGFTASKLLPGEASGSITTCELDTLPVSLSQAAKLSNDNVGAVGTGE